MCERDLEAVSELAMLANPHAEKEKYRKHVSEELRTNPDLSFVAVEGEKVVGYVQGDVHGDIGILEDLAVAEKHQNKGVGTQLLIKELAVLKNKGQKTVTAEVHYKNSKAIPFYYKHSFRLSGCVQDCFGIGHDAILVKLTL